MFAEMLGDGFIDSLLHGSAATTAKKGSDGSIRTQIIEDNILKNILSSPSGCSTGVVSFSVK